MTFLNTPYLAILLTVCVFFGIISGLLALRKGYSIAAWVGTGGAIVLAAIALGFLPSTRNPALSDEDRDRLKTRGNRVGLALSLAVICVVFMAIFAQLISFAGLSNADRSEFFERLYAPASQLFTWIQFLTFVVALSAYAARRREKSILIAASLTLLAIVEAYFVLVSLVERWSFMANLPFQLVYACHYLARALYYFGLTGLCIGAVTSGPPRDSTT